MIKLAITIGCLEIGGAEIFILNLLKRLNYQKYQVLLIVLSKKSGTFIESEIEKLPIIIRYMNKKEGFGPLALIKITALLWRFSPDVLHGNVGGMTYLLPYLFMFRKKIAVHTAHTLANLEYGSFKRKLLGILYRKGRVIPVAISPYIKKSIIDVYRLSDNRVELIYNAVDVNRFQAPSRDGKGNIVIGHVGRLEPVKNHRVIVAVYRNLLKTFPNLRLLLVGDGSLLSFIKEEIKDFGDRAVLIRGTDKPENYYAQIDIFLFPSVYEGLPLSLLEAMAAGCAIVASKTGGIPDLVADGANGYLIDDCNDISAFAGAIRELLVNGEKLKAISKRNIEKAKLYDIGKLVLSYEKLYERVISDANGRI